MGNRQLNRWWVHSRKMSLVLPSLVLVGLIICSIFALRANNLRMLDLREKVFLADEQNGDVNQALNDLQQYVYGHMNTRLPKLGDQKSIQLKHTYDRLVAAEVERVSAERQKIAGEATAYCEAALPTGWLSNRAQCVADYIAARPVAEKDIPKELYSFDFVSPRWSPDLAGWLLVASILAAVVVAVRLVGGLFIRHSLTRHI